jgi:hypothetical protein
MSPLKIWRHLTFIFLLGFCQARGTEYQPWLGNIYEFELRTALMYQDYHWLSSATHLKKFSSNDLFLKASLSNAFPTFGLEVEATGALTRRQRGDVDQLKITGRYVWLDDVAGDALSLTTGFSLIYAFHRSLRDVSSFHHGRGEGEFFISFGKEIAQGTMWGSRWWNILGIGLADRGSPWLRWHLTYEKRWLDKHEIQLFLHTLWGFGHKRLHLEHFHGYGSIQHQSADIGLRYTYLLEYFGSASVEYSYRIHAYNFPIYVHRVLAMFLYTFGL